MHFLILKAAVVENAQQEPQLYWSRTFVAHWGSLIRQSSELGKSLFYWLVTLRGPLTIFSGINLSDFRIFSICSVSLGTAGSHNLSGIFSTICLIYS